MTDRTKLNEGICQAVFVALGVFVALVFVAIFGFGWLAVILAIALGALVIWAGLETVCSGALWDHGPARGAGMPERPALAEAPAAQPAPVAPAAGARVALAQAATDEVAEKTAEGPARLSAPREGGADDLKRIKGVGPKLEAMLNEMGIYYFDQIAGWTKADVAWADEHLVGFRGRVSRDDWVTQAGALATGATGNET
ncbi:NADH:ubiquinone oxidoreductase [Pseudooceanicola nanhaiensis]|uniref:NADH:ubiquinone oxidoreductase n=1 Tax=Pseudooceanicola nanhaiensis TaxID=375761 RepID=UPI001CD27297|nr:NADH:ubiquinone oxidoreductase [Pseudooceanicola nanhaiensis]MCA0921053.1 NADH:ubiquinone oxidoreductase [Pseudooceanicola nanhaiensis]